MELEVKILKGVTEWLESEGIDFDASKLQLQPTKKEFEGDFTFVVFPFVKLAKMAPPILAEKIGEYLKNHLSEVGGYNVIQGFLNIELNEDQWESLLVKMIRNEDYGKTATSDLNVMVEYSSPNTNKPLHLGHLRNNFLGFSVAQILKENGLNVTMANLINDRGIHICKSMVAYERFGNGETPKSAGVKGDHLVGKYYVKFDQEYKKEVQSLLTNGLSEDEAKKEASIFKAAQEMLRKWEDGDGATVSLWKTMNSWVYAGFNETYERIGVEFDQYYYESDTYLLGKDIVTEGLEKDVFFKKNDNSVWCDLSEEGLDEKLVLRGDGTAVYMTQDMGTADLKYQDFKLHRSIYVVGNEQDYHFDVLKRIMKRLEKPYAEGIYHLSYGMVDLPSGKMKSREGTVVDADDLINEMIETAKQRTQELGKIDGFEEAQAQKLYHQLAIGALKYYILKIDPKKRMLFNPKESIDFQGNTGPFIQYTHARISALLRKADVDKIDYKTYKLNGLNTHELENALISVLNEYPKKVKEAGDNYAPSIIANYVYELAKAFNRFYQELPVLKGVDVNTMTFRVALSFVVGRTISRSLSLLGIESPERM